MLWLASVLVPALAGAEDARLDTVELRFIGPAEARSQFSASLAELVGRLGLKLVDSAEPARRLATIDANFGAPSEAVLTVTNASGKIVLLRLIPRGEKLAVPIEAAAHIAQSVVEELRDVSLRTPLKAKGPSPLPDPELVVQRPKPVGRSMDAIGFELGGYADTRIWGGGAPFTVGFALQLELALALSRIRPALVWSGGYQPPFVVANDWATLFAHVVPLRLLAQITPFGGDNWRVDLGLGGGADIFITATRSTLLPERSLAQVRADATGVATAQVVARIGLGRSADLWLGVMADLDFAPRRYVVDVAGSAEELYQPWRVRPAVLLGFSFAASGKEPYAGRAEEAP